LVPTEKKTNATECENFRTISLLSHASKIMMKVLQKRIEAKTETLHFIGEDQF